MSELGEEVFISDLPLWSDEDAHKILISVCKKHGVSPDVLEELVAVQRERQHQERAAGIYLRIEEILGRLD